MEWNGGVDYWSRVLDWSTEVPRPQIGDLLPSRGRPGGVESDSA